MTAQLDTFKDNLEAGSIPASSAVVRRPLGSSMSCILVDHAPSPGLEYPPLDDLIISMVHRSSKSEVIRDVGLGKKYHLDSPRRIFLSPASTASYWSFDGNPTVLHIAISREQVEESLQLQNVDINCRIQRLADQPFDDTLISNLAWHIWRTSTRCDSEAIQFCDQAVHLLLGTLMLRGLDFGTNEVAKGKLSPNQLLRSQEYMRENIGRPVRLAEIASHVGLSPHHFLRAYRCSTGQPPMRWMTMQRIEMAKELLERPELSLTEIAFELGFSSPSHFSATFRQTTGQSPSFWRRMST